MPANGKDKTDYTEIETAVMELFRSEYAPPIPSLEGPDESMQVYFTEEDLPRMSVRITIKLIRDRFPEPLHNVEDIQPLWHWVETVRLDVLLTPRKINDALNQPLGFIERFETGQVIPWQLSALEGADIAILFRLHKDALRDLLRWSAAVYKEREAAKQDESSHPPLYGTSPGALRMFDLAAARMNPDAELPAEAENWLTEVISELERRQTHDLLN
jgi:hypothetical protein